MSKTTTWIDNFVKKPENKYFCAVSQRFITDKFNLYEIDAHVTNYHLALKLILGRLDNNYFSTSSVESTKYLKQNGLILYGLIHQRYIITTDGIRAMKRKYENNDFGVCFRDYCNMQGLLPIGLSNDINESYIRLFCPNCENTYHPSNDLYKNIDGAYFGTTAAHLLLLLNPHIKPISSIKNQNKRQYIPKIFGFSLHHSWHNKTIQMQTYKKQCLQLPVPVNNVNHIVDDEKHITDIQTNTVNTTNNGIKTDDINYFKKIKEKQSDEIARLSDIINKQNKELAALKEINKRQRLALLLSKTQLQQARQVIKAPQFTPSIQSAAPIPINTLNAVNNKVEKEFGDEVANVISGLNDVMNKLKINKNTDHLQTYKKQLTQIVNTTKSFEAYLEKLELTK